MFDIAGGAIAIFVIACLIVLALFILAGFVRAATNLITGIVEGISQITVPARTGRHSGGRHAAGPEDKNKDVPQPDGDTRGWEAASVDVHTGEVKSFVWRGGK